MSTPPLPRVNWLRLRQFRNFPALDLTIHSPMIALVGANGVGKTNILEALSLLAVGRGLRRAALADMQYQFAAINTENNQNHPEYWRIAAEISNNLGDWVIGSGIEPSETPDNQDQSLSSEKSDKSENSTKKPRLKRLIKIDERQLRGQNELGEIIAVAWLTPDMDRIFRDSAQMRRNYLDRLVLALSPAHATHINAYTQAMRERSRLLRLGHGGTASDRAWLNALEETMAAKAVAIAAERLTMVAGINHMAEFVGNTGAANNSDHAANAPDFVNLPIPQLHLIGFVEEILHENSALLAEDKFRDILAATRRSDAESGITQFGIHRSDLVTSEQHRGVTADKLSTGEQKTLLLAIQFAHARLIKSLRGYPPLLLLDDLPAHLYKTRLTGFLHQALALGGQIFVSGTEASDFLPLQQAVQIINLGDGTSKKPID